MSLESPNTGERTVSVFAEVTIYRTLKLTILIFKSKWKNREWGPVKFIMTMLDFIHFFFMVVSLISKWANKEKFIWECFPFLWKFWLADESSTDCPNEGLWKRPLVLEHKSFPSFSCICCGLSMHCCSLHVGLIWISFHKSFKPLASCLTKARTFTSNMKGKYCEVSSQKRSQPE